MSQCCFYLSPSVSQYLALFIVSFSWSEVEGPVGISSNAVRVCVFISLCIIRPVVAMTLFSRCFLSSGFFLFTFFAFEGRTRGIWRFPDLGSNQSYSCWPMPQPQQRGIRATSATYTTALGNAGSLIHWVRPGEEPTTSWFLVGFVSAEPWQELLVVSFLKWKNLYIVWNISLLS